MAAAAGFSLDPIGSGNVRGNVVGLLSSKERKEKEKIKREKERKKRETLKRRNGTRGEDPGGFVKLFHFLVIFLPFRLSSVFC